MSTELSLLKIVANLYENSSDLPKSSRLVAALLEQEKASKKEKISYSFADLIGCWNLRFITGTKKTRKKAGIVLGSGRYIPRSIKIQIIYQGDRAGSAEREKAKRGDLGGLPAKPSLQEPLRGSDAGKPFLPLSQRDTASIRLSSKKPHRQNTANTGRVINSVNITGVSLSLTGPIKFIPGKNILAFDFTTIKITVFGVEIYNGYLKNGREKEAEFERESLKHQAFFSYFFISENAIAARGRGGGLALWTREKLEKT